MDPHDPAGQVETVARLAGENGELVLRRGGDAYEVVSNGVFLMDTRDGRSERLLVSAALDAVRATSGVSVLVGGLGVGFSLAEALAHSRVGRVVVVEREPAVLEWGRTHLAPFSGHALDDPRVETVRTDLVAWLHGTRPDEDVERFDAVCLDIDNGPGWTVTDSNAGLYGDAGLDALARRLRPGGVLTVWGAQASPSFEAALAGRFDDVHALEVPVRRGEPDVVHVARRRTA